MLFSLSLTEMKRMLKNPYILTLVFSIPFAVMILAVILFSSFGFLQTRIGIFNLDTDPLSRLTIGIVMSMFKGGNLSYVSADYQQKLLSGELQAVIIVPKEFSKKLYAGQQTELIFVPSPIDLQVSAVVYRTFRSLLEDLNGSPFFDPQVIRFLFTSPGYPSPKLYVPDKEETLSLLSILVPIGVFLSTACVLLAIASNTFQLDEQARLTELYITMNVNGFTYAVSKILAYTVIGFIISLLSFLVFLFLKIPSDWTTMVSLMVLNALFHACLGIILSGISPNTQFSALLSVVVAAISFYFSGGVVPVSSMPNFLRDFARGYPLFLMNYILRKEQLFSIAPTRDIKLILLYVLVSFTVCVVLGWMKLRRE